MSDKDEEIKELKERNNKDLETLDNSSPDHKDLCWERKFSNKYKIKYGFHIVHN